MFLELEACAACLPAFVSGLSQPLTGFLPGFCVFIFSLIRTLWFLYSMFSMLCQQTGKEYITSYVRNGSLITQSSPVWKCVRLLGLPLLTYFETFLLCSPGWYGAYSNPPQPRKCWGYRYEPRVLQGLLFALGSLDGIVSQFLNQKLDWVCSLNSQ